MAINSKGKITKAQLSQSLIDELLAAAGSNSGGGSVAIKKYSKTITTNTDRVFIGNSFFTTDTDQLLVFKNSVYLELNEDYRLNQDDCTISPLSGVWEATAEEPDTFNFICLMNAPGDVLFSGAKLYNGTVTEEKLSLELQAEISRGAVAGTRLVDGSVTGNKLSNNTITEDKLSPEVQEKLNTRGGSGGEDGVFHSYIETISTTGWSSTTNTDGMYTKTVTHGLNCNDNLIVSAIDTDTKRNIAVSYKVTGLNTIEVESDKKVNMKLMIINSNEAEIVGGVPSVGGGEGLFSKTISKSMWTTDQDMMVYNITHGLNTQDIILNTYDTETGLNIMASYKIVNNNTVQLRSNEAYNCKVVISYSAATVTGDSSSQIDDNKISTTTTYSSKKIDELFNDIDSQKANKKTIDIYINEILPDISNVEDRIENIISSRIDENQLLRFIFTKDTKLSKQILINRKNIQIDLNGCKIISGSFPAFRVTGIKSTIPNVVSFNDDTLTFSNNTSLVVGDYIRIFKTDGDSDLITTVSEVNGTVIKVSDKIDYTISGSILSVEKMQYMNIKIHDGLFEKSEIVANQQDIIVTDSIGVLICNNVFEKAYGLICARCAYSEINHNRFINTDDTVVLTNVCHMLVKDNYLNYFRHGIRTELIYNSTIDNNKVHNGKNKMYSVGIEISSISSSKNKCCYNKITNNTIVDAQQGRAGSAVGGIHLNFNAKNNIISNNTSIKNGIGIYLENTCSYNIIENNNCSHNTGYYGVGIELDWKCNFNEIKGNTCSYNNGDITAQESCGIEVRTGLDDETNICVGNVIEGNTCTYNGKSGIMFSGRDTVISNNTIFANGINNGFDITADIISTKRFENVSLIGNSINSLSNAKYGLFIRDNNNGHSQMLTIIGNIVNGGGQNNNTVHVINVDNTLIKDNIVKSTSSQRAILVSGLSTDDRVKSVLVKDNMVNKIQSGSYNIVDVGFVDGYEVKNIVNDIRTSDKVQNSINPYV